MGQIYGVAQNGIAIWGSVNQTAQTDLLAKIQQMKPGDTAGLQLLAFQAQMLTAHLQTVNAVAELILGVAQPIA